MSGARDSRRKLRKADPVAYLVKAVGIRVEKKQRALEAQGIPATEALELAIADVRRRAETGR